MGLCWRKSRWKDTGARCISGRGGAQRAWFQAGGNRWGQRVFNSGSVRSGQKGQLNANACRGAYASAHASASAQQRPPSSLIVVLSLRCLWVSQAGRTARGSEESSAALVQVRYEIEEGD